MFRKIKELTVGYDISFVYYGNQYSAYVEQLANLLSKDNYRQLVYPINDKIDHPDRLNGRIKHSTLMVVFGTEDAAHSSYIENLIQYFRDRHKKIVCVDMGFAKSSQWYYLLKNQTVVSEKQGFIATSKVSELVFNKVNDAAGFRTRNSRMKKNNLISLIVAIASLFMVIASWYYLFTLKSQLKENEAELAISDQRVEEERKKLENAINITLENEDKARSKSRIANAIDIAVKSQSTYSPDPTHAMMLASEAYNMLVSEKDSIPDAVYKTLLDVFYLQYNRKLGYYNKSIQLNEELVLFDHFSNGIQVLVFADGRVQIIKSDGTLGNGFTVGRGQVKFADINEKNELVFITFEDQSTTLYSLDGELIQSSPPVEDELTLAAIAPSGDYVALGGIDLLWLFKIGGDTIRISDSDERELSTFRFSPVESRIAVAFNENMQVYDFSGKSLYRFGGHEDDIISITYSINGSRILTSGFDHKAVLWSKSGERISTLTGHTGSVNSAIFSPDRTKIVTISDDLTARLWNWDGKFITTMPAHHRAITNAEFSNDSKYIITQSLDNSVIVWDNNGNLIRTLKGHEISLISARFSSDTKQIITTGGDRRILYWPVEQSMIKNLNIHSGGVTQVLFSGDQQKEIISVSARGIARLWDLEGNLSGSGIFGLNNIRHLFPVGGERYLVSNGGVSLLNRSNQVLQEYGSLGTDITKAVTDKEQKWVAGITNTHKLKWMNVENQTISTWQDSTRKLNDVILSLNNELAVATDTGIGLFKNEEMEWVGNLDGKVNGLNQEHPEYIMAWSDKHTYVLDQYYIVQKDLKIPKGKITYSFSAKQNSFYGLANDIGEIHFFSASGEYLTGIKIHSEAITEVKSSANATFLITASLDNSVKICPLPPLISQWVENNLEGVAQINFSE